MLALLFTLSAHSAQPIWDAWAPGFEVAALPVAGSPHPITVVRLDPAAWCLSLAAKAETGGPSLTARQWADQQGFSLVVNAGMFATDHSTHVGFMDISGRAHGQDSSAYQSVALFGPSQPGLPPYTIVDTDSVSTAALAAARAQYRYGVQNLRLIRKPGENRWSQKPRRWSELALAEDAEGRPMLIFTRAPFSMHDLNAQLLAAGIGLVAAQHLEGGPEAQLFMRVGAREAEMFGSFETGFVEHDRNDHPWPVPNVIGVRPCAVP